MGGGECMMHVQNSCAVIINMCVCGFQMVIVSTQSIVKIVSKLVLEYTVCLWPVHVCI